MAVTREDRVDAARTGVRLLLVAVLVGLVAGLATWAFLVVEHTVVKVLWEERPEALLAYPQWAVSVGIVTVMTALAALMVVLAKGRPFDLGHAEAVYDETGRMEYKHLVTGTLFSLFSLFSGAPVGPEAPLTDINGGLGTLVADRLKLPPNQVRVMAYAGVAGAFSAFFGAAPVGALLASEFINPKSEAISRSTVVAGLASGATAWVVYLALGGGALGAVLEFPEYASPTLVDILIAILIGFVAGALGLAYGAAVKGTRTATVSLRTKPWLAALAGGVPLAVAAVASPYLLLSGQTEMPQLLSEAASLGILVLLGLGIGKLALSIWSMSTAYFGGPIFPLIFAGACFGLALNLAIPSIPQGVAVMAVIAGMTVAATAAPLSVSIFLALIATPSLTSVIAVAAVAAYVVRQVIAPTLPGVYRATRAAEKELETAPASE